MPTNKHSISTALPFIIGVTGHRDIAESLDVPLNTGLKSDIRASLEYWHQRVGHNSPIWLLTGLAAGADLLVAEVALELQQEWGEGEIKVIGCLPMPEANYKKDFENLAYAPNAPQQLQTILDKIFHSNNEILVVKNALSPEQEQFAWFDTEYGELRNSLYINQGLFVAKYCNVLLSLWDGLQAVGAGGTADVTNFKLGGSIGWPEHTHNQSLSPISDFDGQIAGLVHHLHTQRYRHLSAEPPLEKSNFANNFTLSSCEQPPTIGALYDSIQGNDQKTEQLAYFISEEFSHLLSDLSTYNEMVCKSKESITSATREALNTSEGIFNCADKIAKKYQKQYRKTVITFFLIALPGFICYELVGGFVNSELGGGLVLTILLAILLGGSLIRYAARNDLKWKYQLARGVAEAMRIRRCLNLANVPPSSSPLIPRRYRAHLTLLNHAIVVAELDWWRGDFQFTQESVNTEWINSQRTFLQKRLSNTAGNINEFLYDRPQFAANKIALWAKRCFYVAIFNGFLLLLLMAIQYFIDISLLSEFNQWLMALVQYSLMIGAVIALWRELAGYESTAKGYSSLDKLYERAQSLLSGPMTPSKQQMLLDLAKEAMYEHVNWTVSEMNNDLKHKK
ncbi:hypothetical protein PCNPT3_11535 [Psychromonas sp. CNPT3]|uniref:hypothetical protein n=1 Tax=Psychromonas sp. CNPT3 TaxID=314282 RepID=UPI00006E38FB|nr:hypothetical protein [Psychromonas sp. CNPT3]AGH82243.1 hypothetical protein PCNPT3_11535 [Psychromonas sp. CNPT3]